ncbi:MAG: universal stress protein [Bryobacteraceae bacterium]
MLSISRILFPVDFSERTVEMLPYAREIASKYNAEITLLNVINPMIAVPDAGTWPPASLPAPDWLLAQQKERLQEFGKEELSGLVVLRLVHEGFAETEIVETAKILRSQLVIIPTHGYGTVRRFLIGSTTSKVLHDLECPVLTGAHFKSAEQAHSHKLKNIVCALDLGAASCDVLTWATRLANDFDSCLSVIHAVPRLEPSLKVVFASDLKDRMEGSIRAEIERLQTTAGARKTTICIEEGEPPDAICSYASSVGADLLVIGRGGKNSGMGRLRANAYSIIRQSACPVLSV